MASQIPFTGGSGRFLDRSLAVADLAKEDIFITNVVHCHRPANRSSQPHEIANCRPYLHRGAGHRGAAAGRRIGP